MTCNTDTLVDAISKELSQYSQDVTDNLKKGIKKVTKECCQEIIRNSPIRSGTYKEGWTTKLNYEGREDIRMTVHNKTNYQLTHLLEFGHAIVKEKGKGKGKGKGKVEGRVDGHPHIGPAEKNASEKLQKRVKVVVKG
ncbi:MAG: HK97 gp10 family phage protein [Oscillospiraceae bacterium]